MMQVKGGKEVTLGPGRRSTVAGGHPLRFEKRQQTCPPKSWWFFVR